MPYYKNATAFARLQARNIEMFIATDCHYPLQKCPTNFPLSIRPRSIFRTLKYRPVPSDSHVDFPFKPVLAESNFFVECTRDAGIFSFDFIKIRLAWERERVREKIFSFSSILFHVCACICRYARAPGTVPQIVARLCTSVCASAHAP